MISRDELIAKYHYCPESGVLTRRQGNVVVGGIEKNPDKPYRYCRINSKRYRVARLAFLYMTGEIPECVTNKNGDTLDNSWKNLQASDRWEMAKSGECTRKKSSIGIHGVLPVKYRSGKKRVRFRARIGYAGKDMYLGLFDSFFEACCARKSAEIIYGFGEFSGSDL
jgi:hypothetical protein